MRGRTLKLRLFLLLVQVGIFSLSGCGDREVPQTTPGPTGVLLSSSEGQGQPDFLEEATFREQWVRGGEKTVRLNLRGHVLVIPKRGLEENRIVLVRISLPVPGVLMVSLEPDGLEFAEGHPASLALSYEDADLKGVPPHDLAIYRETSTGGWERLGGTVEPGEKQVTVDLTHFSRYALASR